MRAGELAPQALGGREAFRGLAADVSFPDEGRLRVFAGAEQVTKLGANVVGQLLELAQIERPGRAAAAGPIPTPMILLVQRAHLRHLAGRVPVHQRPVDHVGGQLQARWNRVGWLVDQVRDVVGGQQLRRADEIGEIARVGARGQQALERRHVDEGEIALGETSPAFDPRRLARADVFGEDVGEHPAAQQHQQQRARVAGGELFGSVAGRGGVGAERNELIGQGSHGGQSSRSRLPQINPRTDAPGAGRPCRAAPAIWAGRAGGARRRARAGGRGCARTTAACRRRAASPARRGRPRSAGR